VRPVLKKRGQPESLVNATEELDRLPTRRARAKAYDLAILVEGITRENLHAEFDAGPPVGEEPM